MNERTLKFNNRKFIVGHSLSSNEGALCLIASQVIHTLQLCFS